MSSTPKRGRPRAEAPLTAVIGVRVTAAQRLELQRVLETSGGRGVSGLLREAVTSYVDELDRGRRRRRDLL